MLTVSLTRRVVVFSRRVATIGNDLEIDALLHVYIHIRRYWRSYQSVSRVSCKH